MAWHPKNLTSEQREERRLEGGRLLLEGLMSQAEIARHLGVSQAAVYHWKHRLDAQHGKLASLTARKAAGAAGKLTEKQWQAVLKVLAKGAIAAGYQTDRWTLSRVRQLIAQRYGISLSKVQIRYHLHGHGWTPQKPQPQASQRDDELIRAWLAKDWPRIKKSLAPTGNNHFGR